MSTISTLVEETRPSMTFNKEPSSDSLIYTSAGGVIYALDGSAVLSLYEVCSFAEKEKGQTIWQTQ